MGWDNSPEDVISAVFARVSLKTGSFSHALVCRTWAELAPMAQVSVRMLEGRSFAEQDLLRDLGHFPNLRLLEVHYHPEQPTHITGTSSRLPRLRTLEVRDHPSQETPPCLSALTELTASDPERHTAAELQDLRFALPPLRVLRVQGHVEFRSALGRGVMPTWVGRLASLQSLELHLRGRFRLPANLNRVLTQLRSLSLELDTDCIVEAAVPGLELRMPEGAQQEDLSYPHLQHLQLQVDKHDRGLSSSLLRCPRLKSLECGSLYKLPTWLGSLAGLTSFSVRFSGPAAATLQLPSSLAALSRLQSLSFTSIGDSVHLPKDFAWNSLSGLSALSLHCSDLSPLLPALASMERLTSLDLRRVDAVSPEAVLPRPLGGGLGALKELTLRSCCNLESLPEHLFCIGSLQSLYLCGFPKLEGIPNSMGQLAGLTSLVLRNLYRIQCIPESLGQLFNLRTLSISYCTALAALPGSMGGLRSLDTFRLWGCDCVAELPSTLCGLPSMKCLDLQCCRSLTQLPEGLGSLQSLRHLEIKQLDSLGSIPDSILQLTGLRQLNLGLRALGLQYLPPGLCNAFPRLGPESVQGVRKLVEDFENLRDTRSMAKRKSLGAE